MDLKITQPMRMIVSCYKGILGSDDDMSVDKFRVQEEIKLKFVSDVWKKILEIFK